MKKVALQLYSIRHMMAESVPETLKAAAKAGYSAVEFAGFFDHTAEEIKSYLDDAGLVCASTHTGLGDLEHFDEAKFAGIVKYHHTIGSSYIGMGVPKPLFSNYDACCRAGELLNMAGEKLRREGITLAYHNHHMEFQVYNGRFGLDLIYENADPANLKLELDCFWAQVAGVDVVEYIRKYGDRTKLLHVKDRKHNPAGYPIERGPNHTEPDHFRILATQIEAGDGMIDYKSVVELGRQFGTDWYILEQEHFDIDPLESIARSARWLNENT